MFLCVDLQALYLLGCSMESVFFTAMRIPPTLECSRSFFIAWKPGMEKFLLGFNQISVQIIILYDEECLMSSSVLFVSCLQFQVSIL